jgi:hypothetical protein
MSTTTQQAAGPLASPPPNTSPSRRRRHGRLISAVLALAVVGAAAGLWSAGVLGGSSTPEASRARETNVGATATVEKRTLSAQTEVDATLGYSGSYNVINRSQGTITGLPALGQVVAQGQRLYSVDGTAVTLLYGAMPAYRALAAGASGIDVQQLNAALVALGYDTTGTLDPKSDYYSWATQVAVRNLQKHLGVAETGDLALGTVAFLPREVRVTGLSATLGGPAQPGQPVMTASSTDHQVKVALDVALQSKVKAGDTVTITLPNDQTMRGVVSSVGTVASRSASGGAGGGSAPGGGTGGGGGSGSAANPTIEVLVKPNDPAKLGRVDQAPVRVSIITDEVRDALVVPLAALLARPGGRYAVEVVAGDGAHHLVDVRLGLVDDADGLVAVTGAGLSAGQTIVVPQS